MRVHYVGAERRGGCADGTLLAPIRPVCASELGRLHARVQEHLDEWRSTGSFRDQGEYCRGQAAAGSP